MGKITEKELRKLLTVKRSMDVMGIISSLFTKKEIIDFIFTKDNKDIECAMWCANGWNFTIQ